MFKCHLQASTVLGSYDIPLTPSAISEAGLQWHFQMAALDLRGHGNSFSVMLGPFPPAIFSALVEDVSFRPPHGTKLSGMIHIQSSLPACLKPSIVCNGISGILTPITGAIALSMLLGTFQIHLNLYHQKKSTMVRSQRQLPQ